MIMRRFLMLATSIAALGFAASQAMAQPGATYSPPQQLSALDEQIQSDYAAIAQDKARMDHDQQIGNMALYREDQNRLYEDTEVQEIHRGTEGDSTLGWTGKSRGWGG
jgi:hypothetical protein